MRCCMSDPKVDAWMPLWIGAYLADTMTLTTQQHGAYLLLLFAYWRNRGPLADDDQDLASIVKASPDEWILLRKKLERFFSVEAGTWVHKRADEELRKAQEGRAKASEKASKAAAAKWEKARREAEAAASSNAPSIAQALPEQCPTPSPISLSSPTVQKEKPERKRAAAAQLVSVEDMVAEGVDRQHAADWMVSRKAKSLPLTPTAWLQTKTEAQKAGLTPAEAIATAAGMGWAGFKATWMAADKAVGQRAASTRHGGFDTKDYRQGVTEDGSLA